MARCRTTYPDTSGRTGDDLRKIRPVYAHTSGSAEIAYSVRVFPRSARNFVNDRQGYRTVTSGGDIGLLRAQGAVPCAQPARTKPRHATGAVMRGRSAGAVTIHGCREWRSAIEDDRVRHRQCRCAARGSAPCRIKQLRLVLRLRARRIRATLAPYRVIR